MVESGGLENRWAFARPVGSNPTPSAIFSLTARRRLRGGGLTGRCTVVRANPCRLEFLALLELLLRVRCGGRVK